VCKIFGAARPRISFSRCARQFPFPLNAPPSQRLTHKIRVGLGKPFDWYGRLLLNATIQVLKIGPDRTTCVQMYGHSWSGDLDRAPQTDRNPGTPAPVFAASSPTPTPSRAVKFGDAAASDCATMLRAYHVQTRCPRSALPGRLAAAYVSDSELPLSENPQTDRQRTQSSRRLCCRRRHCAP
jgi:hypothetical protein